MRQEDDYVITVVMFLLIFDFTPRWHIAEVLRRNRKLKVIHSVAELLLTESNNGRHCFRKRPV